MKRSITFVLIAVICMLARVPANAQHFTIQTNAMQWANLGTLNGAAGISLSRHFSMEAGFRYNPIIRADDPKSADIGLYGHTLLAVVRIFRLVDFRTRTMVEVLRHRVVALRTE